MAQGHASPFARYLAIIKNDPIYRQTLANNRATNAANAAQLGSGILQALVSRGEVPDLAAATKELGLSPGVVKWIMNNVDLGQAKSLAAAGNAAGTSTQAQLDLAHQTNLEKISDNLAARGMLHSGATPEMTGAEEQNYKLGTFAADQKLASYINGAYSAFAGAKQKGLLGLNTALEQAYQRALQFYGSTPPPPVYSGGSHRGRGDGLQTPTPKTHASRGGPGPQVTAALHPAVLS